MTSEWLTSIVCSDHPGAAVVSFQLDIPDTGFSDAGPWNRCRIYLEYNSAGSEQGLPRSIFCKATHNLTTRALLAFLGTSRAESIFYNSFRPLLDIEAPQAVFAQFDPLSFSALLVLADLREQVTEFCGHTTKMTREHVEGQLALLARVHGSCHENARLKSSLKLLQSWPEFFSRMGILDLKDGANRGFLAAEEVIPTALYRQFASIWPAAIASVERHSYLPQTLIHGDVHLKNWYFTKLGAVGLADWETASRGHWGRDIALAMCTALPVDERRAWEPELLRFYVDRLHAAGGPAVSVAEAWTHYRQQLMSALVWWTYMLSAEPGFPNLKRENSAIEFVRRAATAVHDAQSLGSF